MHGAHLRLEAVRVEVARSARARSGSPEAEGPTSGSPADWVRVTRGSAPCCATAGDAIPVGTTPCGAAWDFPWKATSRRSRSALALDRRVAALARPSGQAEALVGFAVLPWCDITLWSVPGSAADPAFEACGWPSARAHAWLRVELAHVDCALAYVEQLPVRESLASKPWRWRWSSAPWHCGFGIKPGVLAPEWTGPARSELWRERLAGAFVDRSDRSVDLVAVEWAWRTPPPRIEASAVDRLARRQTDHSPGMDSGTGAPPASGAAMEPSHGELAVA